MSELELIETTLKRTARRRRVQAAWRGLWQGFLAGAVLWLLILGAYKLLPLPESTLTGGALLAAVVTLGGLLRGLWRQTSLLGTAQWVDDQQHFQERLSTAMEVAKEKTAGHWRDLVVADAAGHAKAFDVRAALPFRLPQLARWCVGVLALAAGLGFVPEYRSEAHQEKQRDAEMIQETGRQLTELVKRQLISRPPVLETTQTALEDIRELGQELTKVKLDRNQALKELASVTDRIDKQLRELGKQPGLRRLDEGMRQGPPGPNRTPEGLQKAIEALQEKLGEQAGKVDALEQMRQELQNLQHAAAGLSQAEGAAADALNQEMSEAMADLASRAQEMGLDLAGLDEAIQAMANGQMDQMLRDLDAAMFDLEKMAQMAKAMQDLQKQLADLGKDLAEQLEKGQGLMAYATLKRMIKELEKADLSDDQLQSILSEVAAAVPAALEYGPLGDFLRQATREMQQGQRPEAAQSLAKAAEELKKLMDQLSDCQGLTAALDALKTGQMCIGNGLGWGLCKAGSCQSFGPGGLPGRGVGTWGDDNQMMEAPDSGLWDNSGIRRPDLDPRGFTDRGDGQVNDALTPTKVRGQISPGGRMPSITLRGVSIKGQSRVEYEERVATAQSDAQSALNHDQVPRAYQGTVRDYFDDLD